MTSCTHTLLSPVYLQLLGDLSSRPRHLHVDVSQNHKPNMPKTGLKVSSKAAPPDCPTSEHSPRPRPAALTSESCWILPFSHPLQFVPQQVLSVLSLHPSVTPSTNALPGRLASTLRHSSQSRFDIAAELSCQTTKQIMSLQWFKIAFTNKSKQCGCSSKKIKHQVTLWSSNSTSGSILKRIESSTQVIISVHKYLYTSHYFTVATRWKQPPCPWTDEWMNKCGI